MMHTAIVSYLLKCNAHSNQVLFNAVTILDFYNVFTCHEVNTEEKKHKAKRCHSAIINANLCDIQVTILFYVIAKHTISVLSLEKFNKSLVS